MKILFATNNQHKISEIQEVSNILLGNKIEFISPKSINISLEPEENGGTFFENADIKALAFFTAAQMPVLADDSGLEVLALDNLPGVNSAQFAEQHNDAANRKKLLQSLEHHTNRAARFCSVLAFYDGDMIRHFTGICNGKIIKEERGINGFGYDSIFIPDGYNTTFAEMNAEEKKYYQSSFSCCARVL